MCFLRLTEQEPMGSHSTKLSFDCSYAVDISANANSTFISYFPLSFFNTTATGSGRGEAMRGMDMLLV